MLRLAMTMLAVGAALALYQRRFLPWQRSWGATPEERDGPVEGDDLLPVERGQTTRAITVDASPEFVWPWLAQMGHGRGGLYSWDFLDIAFGILDRKSATRVLPEFQDLAAGDVIPVKRGPAFPVLRAQKERALVLGSGDPSFPVIWQTELRALEGGRTRLITRNRIDPPATLSARLLVPVLDLAGFIMVRRWLQVLKERGEGLARGRYDTAIEPSTGSASQ